MVGDCHTCGTVLKGCSIRKAENYRSRTPTLLHAALQWNRAEFPVLPGLCLSDSVKENQSDRMKAIKMGFNQELLQQKTAF